MQTLTLKSGETKKGFWNGKNYNGVIYFNVSSDGTKNGINWRKAEKYNREDIKSIITDKAESRPVSNAKAWDDLYNEGVKNGGYNPYRA